jgi:hypothetical protein
MNTSFGFLESQNIAPVWDGESGTGLQVEPDDQNWANMLDQYLNGQLGSQGGPVFSGNQQGMGIAWSAWGTTNPASTTEYLGLLNPDGSLIAAQVAIVDPLLYHPVIPPGIALLGTAVTVKAGATTGNTSTITVTPAGGFAGSVTLTAAVTSSPAGAQNLPALSFGSTSPVVISGTSAGTATLTISTTAAASGALITPQRPGLQRPPVPWYAASGATLACLLLFGVPVRRRACRSILGTLALLAVLAAGVGACGGGGAGSGSSGGGSGSGGGGSTGTSGTTAGSYVITVTGASGAITQTTTVALTVQ